MTAVNAPAAGWRRTGKYVESWRHYSVAAYNTDEGWRFILWRHQVSLGMFPLAADAKAAALEDAK